MYCLPSLFSTSPIMHKRTDTTSLVHQITFCNDVHHAHILVKILSMVSDLRPTCCHAGGKSTFLSGSAVLFGSWLALWILIFPFPTPFTESRKDLINSKSERKEMLWSFSAVLYLDQEVPCAFETCPCSMQYVCVCLVRILKHTWFINISLQSISGKKTGKDIIHMKYQWFLW